MNTPEIKVITGVRRSGKSKLLSAFAAYIQSSTPSANIIMIDLTKLRFEALKDYHALNGYVESHYKPGVDNYLMIDEVQLCKDFELTINSLHSDEKYDIYLTGSNAFILSSDLATLFTGRHVDIHVYPFSFQEFRAYFGATESIAESFESYVMMGGFAGSYTYKNLSDRTKYLRDVYETIIICDLVEKYRISHSAILKKLADLMMDNIGNIVSDRNLTNLLHANGDETSHKTVGRFISYLCNAFVFYESRRYDVKGKTYLQSLGKYYVVDTALRIAMLGRRNLDWGRMLENIIYIELLRRGYDVYIGKLYQKEIDFVAIKDSEKLYIQVSDNITSDETFNREIAPLLQIKDAYPKILLANTRHAETDHEGIRIIDIPRWLLG